MSSNGLFLPKVTPTRESGRGWKDYLAEAPIAAPSRPRRRPSRGAIQIAVVETGAVALRPFPPEYDTWDQVRQRHYERGRLRAAGAHRRYRPVPASEPADVIQRLNGLRLVPRKAAR